MEDNGVTWADRLTLALAAVNLVLTLMLGAIGVYIAMKVGASADRLSRDNLFVASSTLLVDDAPQRRKAGVDIVNWLAAEGVMLPDWESTLLQRVTDQAQVTGPGVVPPVSQQTFVTQSSTVQAANQLVQDLGGAFPRLFIQYREQQQREDAERLRDALAGTRLDGQALLVPQIQHVDVAPTVMDLRYFHGADIDEARQLAAILQSDLHQNVVLNDRSADYAKRGDVKSRTYELWFPQPNAQPAPH